MSAYPICEWHVSEAELSVYVSRMPEQVAREIHALDHESGSFSFMLIYHPEISKAQAEAAAQAIH